MNLWRALVGLALAAFQIGPSALPPTTDQRFEVFGSYVEALRAQANIPGMSAVLVADDIAWERAFGYQDLERQVPTRTDTPFHVDGLTQIVTASLVLRCIEEGRLALTDRLGQFDPASPDAGLTIEQALTHTTGTGRTAVYAYRPAALAPLGAAVAHCTGDSWRISFADWLERIAMMDSVPGADVVRLAPPFENLDPRDVARYGGVLERLAVPYAINRSTGRASPAPPRASDTLTPSSGLVATVRDLAKFDVALRKGGLLLPQTLGAAWASGPDRFGTAVPHGLGWFVQQYQGEKIVWQFGVSDNATSSLVMTVPGRGFSAILVANSDGLVNPYALAAGDLTASPFGRAFLGTFVR